MADRPKVYVSNVEAWRRILEANAGPSAVDCPDCDGRGYHGREGCRACGAFGRVSPTRAAELRARDVVADEPTRPELPEDTGLTCPAANCEDGTSMTRESWGEYGFAVRASTCLVCGGMGVVTVETDAAYLGPRKGSR